MKSNKPSALAACLTLALAACGGGSDAPPAFTNFQPAAVVLGQTDFVSGLEDAGRGVPSASGFNSPGGMAVTDGGILYVPEWDNNRVLGFAGGIPTTNGASASFVLGQASFQGSGFDLAPTSHPAAASVRFGAGKLAVTHHQVSRVVIFNSPPTATGTLPDRLIGEARSINEGPLCRIDALTTPDDAFITADGKLIVADTGNNRVLIWSSVTAPAPSIVLGQDTFDRCAANDDNRDGTSESAPTARTLHHPVKVWSDGTRLVVSDVRNHRVLIWNRFPTGNFQPADVVLGQSTFAGAAPNDDNQDGVSDARPSARTFDLPFGISGDGNRLAIADARNNRVLIWEQFPQQNFQPANVVIGQASFIANAANDTNQDGVSDSAPSDKSLSSPGHVLFHGGDLLVEDGRNHRILVFRRQQ